MNFLTDTNNIREMCRNSDNFLTDVWIILAVSIYNADYTCIGSYSFREILTIEYTKLKKKKHHNNIMIILKFYKTVRSL